jgi:hypothetical protein
MKSRYQLALIIAVNLAAPVKGAVIGTATLVADPANGVPFTGADAALGAPWVSYAIGLATTAGEQIAGIEATITGPLHQRWTYDEDLGAFGPTANSTNAVNGDSHLRTGTGVLFGSGPLEDNSGTGSPLASTATSQYGVGTYLHGVWGLTTAATTANVAYLVFQRQNTPAIGIEIKVASPEGVPIGELCSSSFGGGSGGGCGSRPALRVTADDMTVSDGDVTPNLLDGTDFGTLVPGEPAVQTFTIYNVVSGQINLQPPVLTGPFFISGVFPDSIDAGQIRTFSVVFDSNAGPGNYAGSISFGHNGFDGTFNVNLAARVVPEPASIAHFILAFVMLLGGIHRGGRRMR